MSRPPFRTPEKDAKFFATLARGVSVTGACDNAEYARQSVYDQRDSDPEFRAAWDNAVEAGTDKLEDEAHRRAHDGTEEPVYQGGELVGTIRKYSDTLTIFLLKGRRAEKFRDNSSLNVSGGLDLGGLVMQSLKKPDDAP